MSAEGIRVDPAKIEVVVNWRQPRSEKLLGPSKIL